MSNIKKIKKINKIAKPSEVKKVVALGKSINSKRKEKIRTYIFVSKDASFPLVESVRTLFTPTDLSLVKPQFFSQEKLPVIDTLTTLAIIISGNNNATPELYFRLKKMNIPVVILTNDFTLKTNELLLNIETNNSLSNVLTIINPDQTAQEIGKWIADNLEDMRQAYAWNYDFIKKPFANSIIRTSAVENTIAASLIMLKGADLAIITLNQFRMVLQIAGAYGRDINIYRLQEAAYLVAQGVVCKGISNRVAKSIPLLTVFAKAGMACLSTEAAGKLAIEYFEHDYDLILSSKIEALKDAELSLEDFAEATINE